MRVSVLVVVEGSFWIAHDGAGTLWAGARWSGAHYGQALDGVGRTQHTRRVLPVGGGVSMLPRGFEVLVGSLQDEQGMVSL